jgi:hypothetical protein
MQKEFMENFASASKDAFKPSLSVYNLATRVCEELMRNNMGLINHFVANSMRQAQAVGSGKFDNIIAAHTDNSNKLVNCAQQNFEIIRQATTELSQLFDSSAKDAIKKPMQANAKAEA